MFCLSGKLRPGHYVYPGIIEVIEMWKFLKNYIEGFCWGSDIGLKLLVLLLVIIAILGSCGK